MTRIELIETAALSHRPNSKATLAVVILLACAGVFMFQVLPLYLGAAADAMALTDAEIGMLAGVELLGMACASFLAYFWVSLLNWQRVARFALGVIIVGNLASALAEQYQTLLMIRGLTGLLGQGTAYAVALAAVSDMKNPDRAFGLIVACQVALTMLAMLTLPSAIGAWGPAGLLVPLAAFALLVMAFMSKVPAGPVSPPPARGSSDMAARLPILLLLGAQVTWYLGIGAIWAFVERIGAAAQLEPEIIGRILALSTGISVTGALLASLVSTRFSRWSLFAVAVCGQVIALALLVRPLDQGLFLVSVATFAFTWNFALPYLQGAIAAHDHSGQYTVLIIAAQGLGVALGPIIGGMLSELRGMDWLVYFAMSACVVSILIFGRAMRRFRTLADSG